MSLWKGETFHIIQAMKATGNAPGIVAGWKEQVAQWAQMNRTHPDGVAINAWLPLWQPRPFYTADELAPMWPALSIATGYSDRWPNVVKSARRLEHELDFFRLPRLKGEQGQYFIVERIHFWSRASRQEIEREFHAQR